MQDKIFKEQLSNAIGAAMITNPTRAWNEIAEELLDAHIEISN